MSRHEKVWMTLSMVSFRVRRTILTICTLQRSNAVFDSDVLHQETATMLDLLGTGHLYDLAAGHSKENQRDDALKKNHVVQHQEDSL